MEAELISFIGEHLDYFLFLLVSRTGTVGWTERSVKVPKCAYSVWPLTASMDAYVITKDICNKFIEVNSFVGCMVSWPQLPCLSLIRYRQFTQQCTLSNYLNALAFTTALDTPCIFILHSDLSVELLSKKIRNILLFVHIVANKWPLNS